MSSINVSKNGSLTQVGTPDVMTGSTSENNGKTGLVPTPLKGQGESHYLRADGTWAKVESGSSTVVSDSEPSSQSENSAWLQPYN